MERLGFYFVTSPLKNKSLSPSLLYFQSRTIVANAHKFILKLILYPCLTLLLASTHRLETPMIENKIQNTNVNLDGLLEVLGKNLYSNSDVAIRELVQNAADACHRHRLEVPDQEQDYSIRLTCDPNNHILTIEDNGSGLTSEEVEQFLATIGSGYSRILRHETGTEDIVGYFGLGFLTAYIVASKVHVTTCSYKTADEAWTFSSKKGKTYAITPADDRPRGTTVKLWLEKEYFNLSNSFFLRSVIQKYCCLLQTPIFINEDKEQTNKLLAPWLLSDDLSPLRRSKLNLEFADVFEPSYEPIAVFEIPQDNPHGLGGILWIQGGSSYATTDNRNLSVFTRNMFITNEDKELLPRWAGFVGGVLESAKFKPTASRESLQRDTYYQEACAYLSKFLAFSLGNVVKKEPATWRRIIARHSQALLGAAISDDGLFEASCQTLKVPTSEGDMTIPDLLKKGDGKIYIKPSNNSGHEEVLFRAKGNPLVKGYLYGASGFCQKYHQWHSTAIYTLGTQDSQADIFKTITLENTLHRDTLLKLFDTPNYAVKFTEFDPQHIPLLVMENFNTIVKNKIEADDADKRISTAALSLARLTTAQETSTEENTIYLNLNNDIIQRLVKLKQPNQEHIAAMLKGMMEILCSDNAQAEENLDTVFAKFNAALLSLLGEEK